MQDTVFRRLITSAKVWTIIIGGLATLGASMLAKWGFEVSDAAVSQIAITISGLVAVLVHAQGQADQGKNAKTVQAAGGNIVNEAPVASPTAVPTIVHAPAVDPVDPAKE